MKLLQGKLLSMFFVCCSMQDGFQLPSALVMS